MKQTRSLSEFSRLSERTRLHPIGSIHFDIEKFFFIYLFTFQSLDCLLSSCIGAIGLIQLREAYSGKKCIANLTLISLFGYSKEPSQ